MINHNKQRRAIVTGATGFVGSYLVGYLLSSGWDIDIITRQNSDLKQLLSIAPQMSVHRFDGNINSLRKIIRESNPDVVFHLASLFLSEHQPEDVYRLIESNLLFGTQLVEAMSLEGVHRLVTTGTSWQHYDNCHYNPVNLYAATKQAFDALLEYYVEVRDLQIVTLTLFDTYGPNDPRNKLIKLLLNAALNNTELALSPGGQFIDLVHVHDVASAYAMAAELLICNTMIGNQHFGVSSGKPVTLRSLVAEIEHALGVPVRANWGARPYRSREMLTCWQPTAQLPGWKPSISLAEGLKAIL